MKAANGNSRAVVAALLTAVAMAAIGGTAAVAGPATKKRAATTVRTTKAKSKPVVKKVAPSTTAPAPHDEAAEHAAFAAALAGKLGVTASQVQSALEAIRPAAGTRPDPSQFAAKLGEQLGKPEADVKAALDALRSEGTVHGPGMGHGPDGDGPHGPRSPEFVNTLAAKLGVTADQLKAAFEAIRPAAGTRPDPTQLAAKLAAQLGKTEAEVKTALDAVRPPDGPRFGERHDH